MANTLIIYRGDGSTTDFAVPFDYLRKSFVKVLLDSVTELKGGSTTDTSADYYFVDATTIRLRKIVPTTAQTITIRRYTSVKERVASFRDGSVLYSKDLDTAQVQAFHIAEEARDVINDALVVDRENNWNARNKRIINVGTPVADNDAMTYGIYKADAKGAYQAKLDAERARDRAITAETNAKNSEVNAKESEKVVTGIAGTIVPIAPEIKIVADNIDHVVTDSNSIDNINIVATDLEGAIHDSIYDDYGDLGNPGTPMPSITGGNIKVVSDNIEAVRTVAGLAPDFNKVINSVDTVTKLTVRAETAATKSEASATQAGESEANAMASEAMAMDKATEAKDWANKMTGTVDGIEYSAKYYANRAKIEGGQAVETAKAQATIATNKATEAKNSADNAVLSKDAAKTSENNAKKYADSATSAMSGKLDKAVFDGFVDYGDLGNQ